MPSHIINSTINTANKVMRNPGIIFSMLASIIASVIYVKNSRHSSQEQDEWSETTYFFVNATDAQDEIPNPNDIAYAVSMVLHALTASLNGENEEEQQFLKDFSRLSEVVDNGTNIIKKLPETTLQKWCSELSRTTQIPKENIKAAICILNQSIGNGALNFLYNLNGSKHGNVVAFRSLLQSSIMKSVLKRDASSLSMSYTIPLQAIDPSKEEDLESFDIEKPDIILRSELTIRFDQYYCYQAAKAEPEIFNYMNADAITHNTTVQRLNPAITFDFNRFQEYTDREVDGFILVMLDEADSMYPRGKSNLI